MLVGLAGLLSGYDGSFDFKSGTEYPEHVPYVAMRVMMAMFGVALVPLGWYTAVELGMSWRACHMVALMVLLGVYLIAFCIISQLILPCCRRRLALYFAVYTLGFYAAILYIHYRILPHKVSQPTISVRGSFGS